MADCIAFAARQANINPATVFLGAAATIPKSKMKIFNKHYGECQDCKKMLDSQLNGFGFSFTQNAKNACVALKKPISGCDYVENWNAGGDQLSIQKFKVDCDTSKGIGSDMLRQQTEDQLLSDTRSQNNIYLGVGLFLIMVIIASVFVYLRYQKKSSNV